MPVVAITGASAGIGRATALRLARDGWDVAICARRAEPLEEAARAIRAAGGRVCAVRADVTAPEDMRAFADATRRAFGAIDAVVCNAGYGLYGAIDAVDAEAMRRMFDVNVFGTVHALQAMLPEMRARGRGHIVMVSSIVGRRGIPFMGPYSASKFAQTGLGECVRAELRDSGIHVTLVYPISTETEFFDVMAAHSGFATRASGPRQSAETVAAAIARALRHPVAEVYPYRPSRLLTIVNALAPRLTDVIVRRWGRQPLPPS